MNALASSAARWLLGMILLGALLSVVAVNPLPATAATATVTKTNVEEAIVDNGAVTRSVSVTSDDFPAGATVDKVVVTLNFSRIDDTAGPATCTSPGTSIPWHNEMYYVLTSPNNTRVVLIESSNNNGGSGAGATYSVNGPSTLDVTVVFDDDATAPVRQSPPGVPQSGTFRPMQPLSRFNGGAALGTWTLTIGDSGGGDPTCHYEFGLEVTATFPDTTPPVITRTVSPQPGSNDWHTDDVLVDWSVVDDESTVTIVSGCQNTAITTDTTGEILTCEATSVGGTSTDSVTIKRDATPPTVTYTGNQGNYGLFDTITITCDAIDATSGVASDTCADITGPAASFGPGQHSHTATATDNAGNTGNGTTSFIVGATHNELCSLTQQTVKQPVLARSACATLMVAQLADRAGSPLLERAALASYELQIRMAMARRYVSQTDGATLLQWARTV